MHLIRVAQRCIGHRGACLLFLGLLNVTFGWGLIDPSAETRRAATYQFVASVLPLWTLGALWLGSGLLCLVCAFLMNDRLGFASAITCYMIWGLVNVMAGVLLGVNRAGVSATIWLCLAGWVAIIATWPEPQAVAIRNVNVIGPETVTPSPNEKV